MIAMIAIILLVMMSFLSVSAHARPGPNDNPAFGEWFHQLSTKDGRSCCGIADCREDPMVKSPENSPDHKHWYAYIGKDRFGDEAPNRWLMVPEDAVQSDDTKVSLPRPSGPVVCWLAYLHNPATEITATRTGSVICLKLSRPQG